MRKHAFVQRISRSSTSGCCEMSCRFSRLVSRVETSKLPSLRASAARSVPVYAVMTSWRLSCTAAAPLNGSRHTLQIRSIEVWYFGCVGWSRSTLLCHCRKHSRWTHSFDPRHMHGAMRSPALEKQKRHTDSVASSAPPSPAPEPTVESEAERVAAAAPPPSASLPNSCRQSGLRALKAADRPANCSLSAAVALSEPMASDSSLSMKDCSPTSSVSTDQPGFHVSGW
mmetsp:Transcript_51212/g.169656  ORF Transcript_51212/g.169656 Transcript_51212/m.169656 type:complete len:227 (-) Transcript_51212:1746-2426(-)